MANHNLAPTEPDEVKIYKDGNSMEIHRSGSFPPRELTDRAIEPVRYDQGGCVFVQTRYTDANGVEQKRRFYFDSDACVYRRGDAPQDLEGIRMPAGYLDDPRHRLTIGEQWQSPFGKTRGVVVAVGEAYADGLLDPSAHEYNYPTSPIMRGREFLNRVQPNAVVASPLLPPQA